MRTRSHVDQKLGKRITQKYLMAYNFGRLNPVININSWVIGFANHNHQIKHKTDNNQEQLLSKKKLRT